MSAALDAGAREALAARHPDVFAARGWRRHRGRLVVLALVLYALWCVRFLSADEVLTDADWGIAGSYLADWVSWESRPDIELDTLEVAFPRFDPVGDTVARRGLPDWIESATRSDASGAAPGARSGARPEVRVRMGAGSRVSIGSGRVRLTRGGVTASLAIGADGALVPAGELPGWATQRTAGGKVVARFGFAGRVEVRDDEVRVRRRFLGWENFLFDASSPLHGLSAGELVATLRSPERLDPARSNLALAWHDILYNAEWQHLDVWSKLLQTVVMAFVGTLLATLVAFPLSFLAARTVMPRPALNHVLKRLFDFLRSVDMLIWALFFTRAFGPGPLAGIAAIFLTDTGTLGKLYAEALENVDERQREGVAASGASFVGVQRFGTVPQILPVFLGQALYFWESNTRSATIIGAVGAGGIGLKLWEAMRTNRDWENVFYMVLLILAVVFLFDWLSSTLRRRLSGDGG